VELYFLSSLVSWLLIRLTFPGHVNVSLFLRARLKLDPIICVDDWKFGRAMLKDRQLNSFSI
jgi:hypothetical protein